MRAPIILLLLMLAMGIALDLYIYVQCRCRCKRQFWAAIQAVTAIVLNLWLVIGILLPTQKGSSTEFLGKMWVLFSYFTVYMPKFVAVVFDLVGGIPTLFRHKRWHWLTKIGVVISVAIFGLLWWGASFNRLHPAVKYVDVEMHHLPTSFAGLTIAQISDLHLGTLGNDTDYTKALVNEINALRPDVIVFTGDLVNRQSDEAKKHIQYLAQLQAPLGVYAILGNHDYGDYRHWPSPAAKAENLNLIKQYYDEAGIRLLLNETEWLCRGNDSIALIGVENIGEPPFKVYGSLKKAYDSLGDDNAKILLSHNPRHWADSIANVEDASIDLTLSGHTHAMQVQVGGFSPARWRYKQWGGLYTDSIGHNLYVNIGAGTIGFPMRIGAKPEITLITLHNAKS